MTADVVRTLAAYGPRRFYVLNTGVSTVRALEPAVALLASEGVLMRYTNLATRLDPATKGFVEQEGGTHADEVETSMMLYIDPSSVDMSKAVKDYTPSHRRRTPHAAARRHRHVLADRHLGRSDARDAREGTGVRRSTRGRHRRRHRRAANGAAADTYRPLHRRNRNRLDPQRRRPRPQRRQTRWSAARPATNG